MNAQIPYPAPKAVVVFDIDGVVRDVAGSYRRALADTVEHFTQGQYRPTPDDIDRLKEEGCWNNDWDASQALIHRFFATHPGSASHPPNFKTIVDFFQSKYRGVNFSGYINDEPLLMSQSYLKDLTQHSIYWGFFSGATRTSATYVLEQRLSLSQPPLIAMEDAPGKPNPAGLFQVLELLSERHGLSWDPARGMKYPILYVGDTVADMQTIAQAKAIYPLQQWTAIGIIPPHVQNTQPYAQTLIRHGATEVLERVTALTSTLILEKITALAWN